MKTTYIYGIWDLEIGLFIYIGKSNTPQGRFKGHIKHSSNACVRKFVEEKGVDNFGLVILEKTNFFGIRDWVKREKFWIKKFRKEGHPLCNKNDGGGGPTEQTEEVNAKRSESVKKSWTDERRAEESKRKSGKGNPMYGRHHTEESRAKESKTWQEKGGGHWARNKQSTEHVARRVESRKASWTPEKSAAQSARTKARWADPEGRTRLTEWWTDPEKKATHSKGIRESWTPERREAQGELLKQGWTPERRVKNGALSKASWAAAGPERRTAAAERMRKAIAKPYPAFYNIKTEELIPAGMNLSKLCRGLGLRVGRLSGVATGDIKKTRDGWRLATEKEIL